MKDLVWTAIISALLAGAAVVLGVASMFTDTDMLPAVQGCGMASVALGLASLADRMDVRGNRRE